MKALKLIIMLMTLGIFMSLFYGCSTTLSVSKTNEIKEVKLDSQKKLVFDNPLGDVDLISTENTDMKISIVKSTTEKGSKAKLDEIYKKIDVQINKTSDSVDINVKFERGMLDKLKHYGAEITVEVPSKITSINGKSDSTKLTASKLNNIDELSLSTESGKIDISDCSIKNYSLSLNSGVLNVNNLKGDGQIKCDSSRIKLSSVEGILKYKSDSSSFDIDKSYLKATSSFVTDSGNINLQLDRLDNTGDYSFNSSSGGIELTLPKNAEFNLDITSDVFENDFNLTNKDDNVGKNQLKGVVGSGGAKLIINSTSGKVAIKKSEL